MLGLLAGAQIGSDLLGMGLSYAASEGQRRAAERAARAQREATAAALAEAQRQYDAGRADMAPYMAAGQRAAGTYQDELYGGAYDAPAFDFQAQPFDFNVNTDPGAQYRMDRSMEALQASAAARGGALGSGIQRNMMAAAQDMASQEYAAAYQRHQADEAIRYGMASDAYNRTYGARQDRANRLQGLMGSGQSAAAGQGAAGAQYAGQVGALGMQGTAAANAWRMGAADAASAGLEGIGQGLNNLADSAGQWYGFLRKFGGSGGLK